MTRTKKKTEPIPNIHDIENGVSLILDGLGIDWNNDPNFIETPARVAKALHELCYGLYTDIDHYNRTFPSTYEGIVFFKCIHAVGLCPHHLMPIEYEITFAYIPKKTVLGLSKVPRIIKQLSAQPLLQEDLTDSIVEKFNKLLKPNGLAIIIKGVHGCMKFRGIHESETVVTSRETGFFKDKNTKDEFLSMKG